MAFTRCALSRSISLQVVLLSTVFTTSAFAASDGPVTKTPKVEAARISQSGVPLVFEENAGQLPAGTLFAGRAQAYSVQVKPTSLSFAMAGKQSSRKIDVEFAGAGQGKPEGMAEAAFKTNYYVGSDPRSWHTGVRNFDRVALRGLYPGIDAEFYSHNSEIEHDFLLAPQADASQLSMRLSGARAVRLATNGDLMLDAEEGYLRLHKPVAYQVLADGTRKPVEASFHLAEATKGVKELSFVLGDYDHSQKLVIDPVITYGTYVAGDHGSNPTAIVADQAGNVYLTGSTSSTVTAFGVTTPSQYPAAPATITTPLTFVAQIAAGSGGASIGWLTYFGGTTGSTTANAIALTPPPTQTGNVLYIGGQTLATDLPKPVATTFDTTPTANGSTFGFVAQLSTGAGALVSTTYVEGTKAQLGAGSTIVTALAIGANGAVAIAGTTTGATFSTTPVALKSAGLTLAIADTATTKGIVLELDSALTTENYGTYVGGDMDRSTYLTGIALDASYNVYVSGSTYGDFPKSGVYGPLTLASVYGPPTAGATHLNGFAAQIEPASYTIGYSYWTGGSKDDTTTGLFLDASNNLYITGNTTSPNVTTKAATDSSYSPTPTALTPLNSGYPAGVTSAGYFSKIDPKGGLQVTSYLTSSTSGSTSTVTGVAVDTVGNLYFAGSTDGIKAAFPSQTSGTPVTTTLLPGTAPQDLTQDSTAPPFIVRGYLVQLDPTTAVVNGLAYIGPSSGTASAVSLALDAVPNAYVLLQDKPKTGGSDFVTASAAQDFAQVTDGTTPSAYVAQIAFGAAGPGSLVAGTNSYTPNPAVYVSATNYTTETLTWQITGAGVSGATSIVFNLPYSQYLQTYTLSMLQLNGTPVTAAQCSVGSSTVAIALPGITCVLPALSDGVTDTFVLTDGVTAAVGAAVAASATTITVPAAAFDAQGDGVDLTQTLSIVNAPTFTLTDTVNGGASASVNAALSTTDSTTGNTTVTYVYTIKNTSSVDSPNTKLATNLGTSSGTFSPTIPAVSSTGCDPTTATNGCDIAAGATLTYTVTGVYLGSNFSSTTPGPFTSNTSAPTLSFTPVVGGPPVTGTALSVTISGNASISASINTASSPFTYNGTSFKLGDSGVKITVVLTNSGPNEVSAVTATPTLPKGFVATAYTAISAAGGSSCSSPTGPSCTVAIYGNSSASIVITGTFSDTGTTGDAVAPPATAAAPTPATVAASSTSGAVTAVLPVAGLTTSAAGTYVSLPTTAASDSITVTRVNSLAFALSATAPLTSNSVNETNSAHVSDSVTYTATVANTGTSVTRGLYFTFPIPVSATGTTATISGLSYATTGINAANQLQCSASASTVTCYEADLTAVSTGPVVTPAALTYTVTFNATFPETTIPLTTVTGTTTATQGAGTFYAAAATYTTANVSGANPTTVNVQRSTKVTQTLTLVPNVHAPAGYADTTDLNLDEHVAGNAPGVNDSLVFTAVTYNAGVNDAAGVSVSIPVPPYLLIFSALPATCSINGVAAPTYPFNTGATGVTLTCAPASSTTAAGTGAGQLTAAGGPCTATSGACLYLSFAAKFADASTAATIVGNATKVTVTPASAVATGNNVDVGTGLTSPTPTPFGVQRAAHLLEVLAVAPQVHAPAAYSDKTDINLDEHVANNAGGVNDQLIVTSSTSNTGVNYALNVSVVVPLPAYLEFFSLPTGCVITGAATVVPTAAAPYTTSATGGSLTCVVPPAVSPSTTNSVLQYSGTCAAATNAQCLYLNFLAKFVDAPSSATIVGNNSTAVVTPVAATVAGTFSDSNTTQTPNTPATFSVQRAAHLRLASSNAIAPTYTDNSALALDGVTPVIGQAAVSANALTRVVNSAAKVYNCIRYTVTVVNEGPNYTNSPTLNYAITQAPFTAALKTVGTAPTQGPVNCTIGGAFGGTTVAAAPQALPIGSVAYGNGTQTVELDGYFGLNALGGANNAVSAFQTSAFTTLDYQDSDTTGTSAKDYAGTKSVEIVNTPINNSTVGGFTITPAGAVPAVSLIFTSVTSPGTTSSAISTTAPTASVSGGILPSGKSPYPPDASAVKKLYQSGQNPVVYSVPSTAIVPTAATNPTSVCIAQAGGLPDLFVKPERSLLWALQNVPAGTVYNSMGPASGATIVITPTGAAPATGDITVTVAPNGATPYVAVPSTLTFPQPPQAQPSQLCGQVNGFTASTANPVTFAVLEPVNFPPYVVANSTSVSAQTGKGSISSQTDVYLQVSSSQTHDFNDKDPCYIGGVRSYCDDNPYLDVFVFGGGNLGANPINASGQTVPLASPIPLSSLATELNCNVAAPCPNGKNVLQSNLASGVQAYVAIADQATGADALDDYVVSPSSGTSTYTSNPFTKQGNFLTSNKAGGFTVCDPGIQSGYYAITPTGCATTVLAPTTAVPSELYVPAGPAPVKFTVGNVGAQVVTGASSGGSGLIPLPYPSTTPYAQVPANPTAPPPSTSTTPVPAIAYVTPGQTAGFIWNWLNGSVQQSAGAAKYYYTLACVPVTSLTNVTPVTLPAGTTCNISTADPNAPTVKTFSSSPSNYAPTIYVTTSGNLFARLSSPAAKYLSGGVSLALLLPLFALRRRFRRGMVLAVMLLSLAAVPMLTGCGSSSAFSSSANVTPAGTYYFQVTATSTTNNPQNVYSAVFEVVVQPAN